MTAAARGDSLEATVQQLVLARASALARAGDYRAAEELLAAGGSGGEDAAALDLHARICAQQGRYSEAAGLWRRAVQLDPAKPEYAAALRLAARSEGRPAWLYGFSMLLMVGVLLSGAALAGIAVFGGRGTKPERPPDGGGEPVAASAEATPPGVVLENTAVEVKREGKELVVTFRAGLFSKGARLTREGRAALASVGRQLEPQGSQLLIRVVGSADNAPPPRGYLYGDNTGLGFERARVAAERLRAAGRLPQEAIVLESRGEEAPPYSNETEEGRARNRTVVLRVARRQP